jgi:hypothetical protein
MSIGQRAQIFDDTFFLTLTTNDVESDLLLAILYGSGIAVKANNLIAYDCAMLARDRGSYAAAILLRPLIDEVRQELRIPFPSEEVEDAWSRFLNAILMLQATHNSADALVAYQYLEKRVLILPDTHHAKRIQCICTPHWHWIPEVKSNDGLPLDGSHSSAWARLIILFDVASQFVQANRPIITVEGHVPLPSVRMFVVAPDKDGYTPFCFLAPLVHPDKAILSALTQILIANGALADETSDERYRPLFWAVASDNVQIAKILVQNGAGSTLGISTGGYRTDDK